ncbi:hypothetical protein E8E12_006189 [Didymella heteroderae]|uniref:F-box domain-containing protein n=1 Tax=Didymella heteroderae TaxID=1769908 RepID=A0A9P4WPU3_9PLEO|nr:hypothetical protein E8E12_006189 [Didymella heteroderae]
MVTFLTLPVEIQRRCVNYLDTAALKSTRLVCRALREITAESLFGVATLQFTRQSADKFQGLLQHDVFGRYIRQIDFGSQWKDSEDPDEGCHSPSAPKWWKGRVAEWSSARLPHLNKLVLDTAYACISKQCSALELALDTFVSLRTINSLTIKHLQDDCQARRPDFAKLPTKPKKLHLLITTWSDEASTDMDIEIRHRHAMFNVQLNATWLEPLQSRLTHLTLHCDTYWGIYPRWQPKNLKFPHLKSLAFGKWTIAYDWQIDFITSHGPTLEQLIFTRCPIMHASRLTRRQEHNLWRERLPGTSRGGPPTTNHFSDLRWHTLLPQLASGLPKLTHFSMGRGPDDDTVSDAPSSWPGPGFYGQCVTGRTGFEHRYSQSATIDWSRYIIFEGDGGPTEWQDADLERGGYHAVARGWGSSFHHEKDEDWKRGVQFPDCLREDEEALEDLLRTIRDRS